MNWAIQIGLSVIMAAAVFSAGHRIGWERGQQVYRAPAFTPYVELTFEGTFGGAALLLVKSDRMITRQVQMAPESHLVIAGDDLRQWGPR